MSDVYSKLREAQDQFDAALARKRELASDYNRARAAGGSRWAGQ
jgi:hypothetical protein